MNTSPLLWSTAIISGFKKNKIISAFKEHNLTEEATKLSKKFIIKRRRKDIEKKEHLFRI